MTADHYLVKIYQRLLDRLEVGFGSVRFYLIVESNSGIPNLELRLLEAAENDSVWPREHAIGTGNLELGREIVH